MASNYNSLASARKEYARILPNAKGGFRGVDFSSSPHQCELYRLPDLQNMYRDYRSNEGGALETIPGFRRLYRFEGATHGIFRFDNNDAEAFLAVHAGTKLYLCRENDRDGGSWACADGSLEDKTSRAFVYNGTLYILDGTRYQRLKKQDDDSYVLESVTENAYVPKTWYMGEQYEQRNTLSDRYVVEDIGSSLVSAPATAEDQFTDEGEYLGKDSFVLVPGGQNLYQGVNKGVSVMCFVASRSSYNAMTVYNADTDNGITDIAIVADGSYGIRVTNITNCQALRRLYLHSGTMENCITFDEGCRVEMKGGGQLFMNCSMQGFEKAFSVGESASDVIQRALVALPPNLLGRVGTTVVSGDGFEIASPSHQACYSTSFASDAIWVNGTLPSALDESKIYIHNVMQEGKKFLAVTVGANVSVGRYYFYGSAINARNQSEHRMWRVEVVAKDEQDPPIPVQDVFGFDGVPVTLNLPEKTKEVYSVADGEFAPGFGCIYDAENNITAVGFVARKGTNDIKIEALATDYHVRSVGKNATYMDANPDYKGTSEEAINGCTLCAIYDDRIFLAGNPALPNTVFYSARNDSGVNDPSYFGVLNYFNDGAGWDKVMAIFSFSDTLCVAKKGSVYYHQGADGSDYIPRVYPSVKGNAGLGSLGACCNFLDDPVMLTTEGVWGINKETLTLERTLGRRSSTVDARLLTEQNLGTAEMVEWEGYLCLFVNGHVYMADSRSVYTDSTGGMQYEWFYLSDVGIWRDEKGLPTPIYAAVTGELSINGVSLAGELVNLNGTDYALTETHDELRFTSGEVYEANVGGVQIKYAVSGEKAYAVYETEELAKEGSFHPGVHPLAVGERLYFGTDTGEVFVFNNDMRGVEVDDDELSPTEIHHSFYSFAGHRIESGFLTAFDNCGVPHLCKSTSSRSLTLRVKLLNAAEFTIAVSTEQKRNTPARVDITREKISSSSFSFGRVDFSTLTFFTETSATVVASERERRWVEKQYLLRDGGYCRPFGIYDMSYRYRIAGRIRE